MNEENRQKMITAMQMMKEACDANDSWAGCTNCPFDSDCTALGRAAIELYKEDNYEPWCPIGWEPDELEEEEK